MPSPFHRFEIRRTKIKRRCSYCSKIIQKKQTYYRSVSRKHGAFTTTILCCQCGAAKEMENDESNTVFDSYLNF